MSKYVIMGPDGEVPVKQCARCAALVTVEAEGPHALWHHVLTDLAKRVREIEGRLDKAQADSATFAFEMGGVTQGLIQQTLTDANAGGVVEPVRVSAEKAAVADAWTKRVSETGQ